MVVDICRSLARYGPRRFYVINTGATTVAALSPAADVLAREGILLKHFGFDRYESFAKSIQSQERGTHADEMETSMMLYIAPATVDMKRAVKDYGVDKGQGPLVRDPRKQGKYSPTGVFGDATLATREKGRKITEAVVEGVIGQIEDLRRASPPSPQSSTKDYDAYLGQYEVAANNTITISKEGGSLVYQRNGGHKINLTAES